MADKHHQRRRIKLAHDHGKQGDDLRQGIGLAEEAWLEVLHADAGIEDGRNHNDAEIASEHKHRDAEGDEPFMMQHKEERAEQQLVGHGVKVLSEHSALLEQASEQAVEAVGDSGENEEREGGAVVLVKNGQHEKWNDAQPQ